MNGVVIRLLFPFTVRNPNLFFFLVVLCILPLLVSSCLVGIDFARVSLFDTLDLI